MENLDYQSAKGMKLNQLREEMRKRGYDTTGTKQKLLNRLIYFSNPNRSRKRTFDEMTNDSNQNNQASNSNSEPPYKKQKLNNDSPNANISPSPSSSSLSVNNRSIDNILPKDVIQHILTFDDSKYPHMVNKQWYSMYKNIKQIKKREVRKFISDYAESFKPPFDHENTIVVDQNRTELTDTERSSGFEGPFQFLLDALDECKLGDRILLYPGKYRISNDEWRRFKYDHQEELQLQFIGMGEDVYLFADDNYAFFMDGIQIYFENIKFLNTMVICSASVWIKDCVFDTTSCNTFAAIFCGNSGSVRVLQTRFLNITDSYAVFFVPYKNVVEFIGCEFENIKNKRSCVAISNYQNRDWVSVKIIGNVFENINCVPIRSDSVGEQDSWEMYGNILKGTFEVDGLNKSEIDPNVFYFTVDFDLP